MECIACGGKNFSVWGRKDAYEILKCAACGLGITWPQPSTAQIGEFNRDIYSARERAAAYEVRRRELDLRHEAALVKIMKFKRSGVLLDIGCNIGVFLKAARSAGFDVFGSEINTECATYGREKYGLDIRPGVVSAAGFNSGDFDVVTLFDVLEHVPEPFVFLKEVKRLLKSDGLLVLQAPNFDSFMAGLMRENWAWLTPPDHLYHFTPGSLLRLLKAVGFEIEEISTWEPAGDFIGNIYSDFPARSVTGRILRKFLWFFSIFLVPFFQRLWWKAGKGGLIGIYAVKR
ncbi:MAG: hypothetical protein COT17_02715 [Elusimicrobia bacterium CG08_land_8_20_14_0_20_51_18]|nr:MAG: hypothetical protein COT17_02715 [Elusimicrobia bacterium CG08_land_8_20_14_0_20_51_18]